MRVAMLVVIAIVALGNALEWTDADLSVPFVCIIAVMGIGTRGGLLDTVPFVVFELLVVIVLGIATFSDSRDFVWAASVAISIVAVAKIAVVRTRPAEEAKPKDAAKPNDDAKPAPKPKRSDEPDAETLSEET
jgi:hypothetical protein